MEDLDRKKKSRVVIRSVFTRLGNELEQLLSAQTVDLQKLQVTWELLLEKCDELKVLDSYLYEMLLDEATEDELVKEVGACDAYRRRFTDLRLTYEKCLGGNDTSIKAVSDQVSVVSVGLSDNSNVGKRNFKLPRIEFKRYDGNIRDWLSFWAQFKKVHEDPDIDEHDKIEYLLQATVPNSRARQLVESFPVMRGNYDKIIECMQSRFGREDLQIEFYVRELLTLILHKTISRDKMDLCTLYDKIETQIRSLETLGITSEKCSAILFPLIESCLPQELLRVWQRTAQAVHLTSSTTELPKRLSLVEVSLENRLASLMQFLKNEVENEQRISLVTENFGLSAGNSSGNDNNTKSRVDRRSGKVGTSVPSATDLVNCDVSKCIFCDGSHRGEDCMKARKISLEDRKKRLTEKRACFRCLIPGHLSKKCRVRLSCVICSQAHVPLMCPQLSMNKAAEDVANSDKENVKPVKEQSLTNCTRGHVFLQTLRITLKGDRGTHCSSRVLIDSGSQRSYILKSTALKLGYRPKRKESIVHCLFSGKTITQVHNCYDVTVYRGSYSLTFEALDQTTICTDIPPIFKGTWLEEVRNMNIELSDVNEPGPIELLLGADVIGQLYVGDYRELNCGLIAAETHLGWTLMGKVSTEEKNGKSNLALTTLSLLVREASITELWKLDVLGITEPSEKKTKEELSNDAKDFFLQTMKVNDEGRYEVRLPWIDGHPPLPDNYELAKGRLRSTVKRLKDDNLIEEYRKVLHEWLLLGVIEKVTDDRKVVPSHYLPHRAVLKPESTTKIRPVFDASAHEKGTPSINDCLEKGPNLIEEIPSILLRFRENRVGVISDIKKAFLQISVNPRDRDSLRFLWLDQNEEIETYRHRRVVFGINCSPFLLGQTIEYHLAQCLEMCRKTDTSYTADTIIKLSKSFYVDNCITSVQDENNLERFIQEATLIMEQGKFELRGWEHSRSTNKAESVTPVLGLQWCLARDTLRISDTWLTGETNFENVTVTKRLILSMAQRLFDPIGLTCAATLMPKLWLQRLWKENLRWDDSVDAETEQAFRQWIKDLPYLFKIEIPRWVGCSNDHEQHLSIHTFCDASKNAFACVIFLRIAKEDSVSIHLLAAKARVAPLRGLTIPRLELLAATIGARLYSNVMENLNGAIDSYFWSDSSTVVAWIQRKEEWATFVWNRIAEIRTLTSCKSWRHIPGSQNPADLPSRGCSPKYLLESRWWEGPQWLYGSPDSWPCEELACDEIEINQEKKKKLTPTLVCPTVDEWHLNRFSSYTRSLRLVAWILRFCHNIKHPDVKRRGELNADDMNMAERHVVKIIQSQSFSGEDEKKLTGLNPFYDSYGVLRLKTRVSRREDFDNFRHPIVLPSKHPVVESLILEMHKRKSHAGTQMLLSLLREDYWIIGGRRTIRSVLSRCAICKRHNSRPFVIEPPPLPKDRVRDAVAFEVTGVDMAGPLQLQTGEKAWVCLFTCAIYRAVHLELCKSMSTTCFMKAFRRFVARRGRPKVVYSDCGTNFVGMDNVLSRLDWNAISRETSIQRVKWRFNPPTAAWWGGFWERLIGVMKQMLRKVLGRSSLDYEDLLTVLCDCESVINSRPLTYVSNDPKDLVPITPSMFLRDLVECGLPDCDIVDQTSLNRKLRHRQRLRQELRHRFRNEYLGQLKLKVSKKTTRPVTLGEVVLVGNDNDKRLHWPLGRIIELIPGSDGKTRLVRVKTERGQLLRPIQRIYPLECLDSPSGDIDLLQEHPEAKDIPGDQQEEETSLGESAGVVSQSRVPDTVTRCGRVVRLPKRFL